MPGDIVLHEAYPLAFDRAGPDQRRSAAGLPSFRQRLEDLLEIVPVDLKDVPVEGAPLGVDRLEIHHLGDVAVDLSIVVVEDDGEGIELEFGSAHRRFPDLPLLRLTVANHAVDVELAAAQLGGNRHSLRDGKALAERAGARFDDR